MMDSASKSENQTHIVVCPSAGIGHLAPFLRLASMLATSSECNKVTLVTLQPTLSSAESTQISYFLSSYPQIRSLDIHIHADKIHNNNNSSNNNNNNTRMPANESDPFFLRYMAISKSASLLTSYIANLSPPPTAVFSELIPASGLNPGLAELGIPNYLLFTSSARMFALISYLPHMIRPAIDKVAKEEVVYFPPGMKPILKSCIPPPFFSPDHIFTQMLITISLPLPKFKGILLNTFDAFEIETISSLQTGEALPGLPPVYPIGPLKPWNHQKVANNFPSWLDTQPAKSVLYISFGSRTAIERDQMKELGAGLELAGVQFLWVVKTRIVDNHEPANIDHELRLLLGEPFFERTKGRGVVVKEWIDQEAVLDHPAIGGFMSHCGWNSIAEAANRGVPVLAWPQHGDQKVNAAIVEKVGLGVWDKGWGWGGERVVKREEIAEKINEVMMNQELRVSAERVGREAVKAWGVDGSSSKMFAKVISDVTFCE